MLTLRYAIRSTRTAFGAAVLIALLAGCGGKDVAAPTPIVDTDALAAARFDSLVAPFRLHSGIQTSRRVIIDNVGDWLTTWDELTSTSTVRANPPDVDFNKYMVVVVASGAKPTSGYCIDISAVVGFPNGLFILVNETEPPPDEGVLQVLSQPTDFKLIVRTESSVRFLNDRQTGSCSGS